MQAPGLRPWWKSESTFCMLSCCRVCPTVWPYGSCDPMVTARQAPLSTGFSRQEYWSGLPFPSPGDLPDPGTKTGSLTSTCIGRQVLYHTCHTLNAGLVYSQQDKPHLELCLGTGIGCLNFEHPGFFSHNINTLPCVMSQKHSPHQNLPPRAWLLVIETSINLKSLQELDHRFIL